MQRHHKKSSSSSVLKLFSFETRNVKNTTRQEKDKQQPQLIIRCVRNRSHTPERRIITADSTILLQTEEYSLTPDCLLRHNINEHMRAKMVDWMIEVTSIFQSSPRTFFIAVKIMDKFFTLQNVSVSCGLLHIIGLTSLFISSKYEDVITISTKDVVELIAHNKISSEDLFMTEQAILKKLGFFVNFVTRCDFIEEISKEISLSEELTSFALFLSQVSMHIYSHLSLKESQIAYCCLFISAKALKKEESAIKILAKCVISKVFVDFESFKSDLLKFKTLNPRFQKAQTTSKMDFGLVDGVFHAFIQ